MVRISLLLALLLIISPVCLDAQDEQVLTPDEFMEVFSSLENSKYIKFLEAIRQDDQSAIDKYIQENDLIAIVNSRSFHVSDMSELKKQLELKWPSSSSIVYQPEKNSVSYNYKTTDSKSLQQTSLSIENIYSLRRKSLAEFLEAVDAFDRSVVTYEGNTVYGYHKGVLNIFLVGDLVKVVISNKPGDLFLGREHSLLDYALQYDRLDIISAFMQKGMRIQLTDTVAINRILLSDKEIFESFLPYIDDPDTFYKGGMNLLHFAARLNQLEKFSILLANGFDLDRLTEDGMNCAHLAAYESPDILEEIYRLDKSLISGASPTGIQPIHIAAKYAESELVELLLSLEADVNSRDNKGTTPLMLASEFNNLRMVNTLLRNGANLKLQDEDHLGNLHYAIRGRNCSLLYYCLRNKKYDASDVSLSELREFGKENKFHCWSGLKLTKEFHMEFKFQLNTTAIGYEGASYGISGGYGLELSRRIFPYGDLSYSFNRLYVESGIRNTAELIDLETNDEHYAMYETNYFDNLFSLKLYPVHYLNRTAPYLRLGYDFRIVKESGLLGGTSEIMDDLSGIALNNYQALTVGLGFLIRDPVRFSTEIYYSYGLTDVNNMFPGSYNTFSFVLGLGF